MNFIEGTLRRLDGALELARMTDHARGLLVRLDPRAKLAGFAVLIFAVASVHRAEAALAVFLLAAVLSAASGRVVFHAAWRLWLGVLLFSAAMTIPAIWLAPGANWRGVATLIARAEATASLAALLALTTPWPHLLKALRSFRAPELAVVLLNMTYRFVFTLIRLSIHLFESRRVRRVGRLSGVQQRKMAVSGAAALFSRSIRLSGETYDAMRARGFQGVTRVLVDFQMRRTDWLALVLFWTLAAAVFILGRHA